MVYYHGFFTVKHDYGKLSNATNPSFHTWLDLVEISENIISLNSMGCCSCINLINTLLGSDLLQCYFVLQSLMTEDLILFMFIIETLLKNFFGFGFQNEMAFILVNVSSCHSQLIERWRPRAKK